MTRDGRVPSERRVRDRAAVVLLAVAATAVLIPTIAHFIWRPGPGDAFNYLAAGERLNAGHDLYALVPGDRPVILDPPSWTVPLLSPPFMAVVWRPLAALPWALGAYLWWLGSIASILGVIVALTRARPIQTAIAVILLAFPLAFELNVGNVNGYILLGTVLAWRWHRQGADRPAGFIVGVMAGLKLYPVTLGIWMLGQRRRGSIVGLAAGAVAVAIVSLVGAGWAAHVRYLEIMREKSTSGVTEASLAGWAMSFGVPHELAVWLPILALVVGSLVTIGLARRPGPSFAVAVATMVLGSAAIHINTPTLLLGMLAPLAWPLERSEPALVSGVAAPLHAPSP